MMILFGIRSPIVVEFEETCRRLDIAVSAGISVNGTPRLSGLAPIIEVADYQHDGRGDRRFIACAFTPGRRRALVDMALERGLELCEALIDPHAILPRAIRVGGGTYINAGAVIGAVSMIGENVLVNRAASLGHHTVLGDFVSVGPGATLAGDIRVGEGTVIGAGSTVLPDLRIGANAVIAAGSLVRRDVPDGAFVAGNPAVERAFNAGKSRLNIEDGE